MKNPAVLVIDSGLGNIGSVVAAFERQVCTVHRLSNPPAMGLTCDFSHVVLPGVGSFTSGMKSLRQKGWADWLLQQWCPTCRPLLGICLGMQMLASSGSEGSVGFSSPTTGLDLIPGRVDRMNPTGVLPLPHVGWNSVEWSADVSLAANVPSGGDFYFVHSYAFTPNNHEHSLANSTYGGLFTSVVGRAQYFGVQFHPEKSQRLGRQFLSNFLALN